MHSQTVFDELTNGTKDNFEDDVEVHPAAASISPFHALSAKTLSGESMQFSSLSGSVTLVVNVASQVRLFMPRVFENTHKQKNLFFSKNILSVWIYKTICWFARALQKVLGARLSYFGVSVQPVWRARTRLGDGNSLVCRRPIRRHV